MISLTLAIGSHSSIQLQIVLACVAPNRIELFSVEEGYLLLGFHLKKAAKEIANMPSIAAQLSPDCTV